MDCCVSPTHPLSLYLLSSPLPPTQPHPPLPLACCPRPPSLTPSSSPSITIPSLHPSLLYKLLAPCSPFLAPSSSSATVFLFVHSWSLCPPTCNPASLPHSWGWTLHLRPPLPYFRPPLAAVNIYPWYSGSDNGGRNKEQTRDLVDCVGTEDSYIKEYMFYTSKKEVGLRLHPAVST